MGVVSFIPLLKGPRLQLNTENGHTAVLVIALRSDNQALQNLLVKRLSKQWRVLKENIKMGVNVWTDLNWLKIGCLSKLTTNHRVSCKAGNVWATWTSISLSRMILLYSLGTFTVIFSRL
jgi:hypothetical protein